MRAEADPALRRYLLASIVSITGTAITLVVLPILVYQRTGSAFETALLTAIEVLPYIVLGLIAGPLADRVDRRRLMVTCNVINAVVMLSVPLAEAAGALTIAQIYAVALLGATTFVFFDAADFGALPTLAGREGLVAAASLLQSTRSLLLVIMPAVGALLAATIGAAEALAVDAASFLVAGALLLTIRRPFQGPRDQVRATYRADLAEGLRWLWQHRLVRALTLVGFGNSVGYGMVFGLTVVYGVRQLGLASDDVRIGLLFSAGAVGGVLGAAVMPTLRRRMHPARVSQIALAVTPLLILALVAATSFPAAAAAFLAWTWASQVTIVNGITYRMQVIPDALQSRVNVVGRMVAWGGQPFGATIGGAVASVASVRSAFLLAAAIVALTAAAGYPVLRAAARGELRDGPPAGG